MTLDQIIIDNLSWILGLIFAAGGLVWTIQNLSRRLKEGISAIRDQNADHEGRIRDVSDRMSRLEERVDGHQDWMQEVRDQIRAIHDKIMKG